MDLARYTERLQALTDVVEVFSDFTEDQSDVTFIDTLTDTGTAAVGDSVNGVMVLTPSDGTVADNDECILRSANENFLFGTSRSIYGKARLRFTEVAAGVANVGFGFMNAAQTDPLADNAGGVKLSGSTAAIFKIDGEQVWRCASACNGTSTTTVSTTAAVAATDYVLEIMIVERDGVSMTVSYKVDGAYLKDSSNNIIRHTVLMASATEMNLFAAIKLGAGTNNDTLLIDYLYGCQTRV